MPIIWRFLLTQYLKVLTLSVIAFIGVLMTTRLDELAQFAVLGAQAPHIWQFALYQIPYILPIALVLSALISALLLMQRLSGQYELTALRACGYGMGNILAPLLLTAILLGIGNFYVTSELATHSHMMRRAITREIKSMNPLVLLQNQKVARLKGVYVSAKGALSSGEQAKDVALAAINPRSDSLDLFMAQEIQTTSDALQGSNVTVLSSSTQTSANAFPTTYAENALLLNMPTKDLSGLMGVSSWRVKDDYLNLGLLLDRLHQLNEQSGREIGLRKQQIYSEIMRRLALALAVLTFTFMGLAYGIYVSRHRVSRHIGIVIGLAALALTCFFLAKGQHKNASVAALLYFGPQVLITFLSVRHVRFVNQGALI